MLLKFAAIGKLFMSLSVVSCAYHNILTQDIQNADHSNRDLRELFDTRPVDFIKSLTEKDLRDITSGHRYLLRSLSEEDVKNMPIETCGHAVYNCACMRTSTLKAVSKECIENFITRIPAGIAPLTVAVIPVSWFILAGEKLLTSILSLDPSNLQRFSKNVFEYINTNPDGLCKNIPASSLVNLSSEQKKLLTPACLAEIENVDQTLFFPQSYPEDYLGRNNGNVHTGSYRGNQVEKLEVRIESKEKESFLDTLNINRSLFGIHGVDNERNLVNSTVAIRNVQSSAISLQTHLTTLSPKVPIAKNTEKRSMFVTNEKPVEKEEMVENKISFKEGDIVIQPFGVRGKGPFVVVKISENDKLLLSDCKTGKYKRHVNPTFVVKYEGREVIACPVFKLLEKVAVQRENGKLVGPYYITAIDSAENAYLLSKNGSGHDPEFFEVPWNLLRHYDEDKNNYYVEEKLEGTDIAVHRNFNIGDKILFPIEHGQKIEFQVSNIGDLKPDGNIRIRSTFGEIFYKRLTTISKVN